MLFIVVLMVVCVLVFWVWIGVVVMVVVRVSLVNREWRSLFNILCFYSVIFGLFVVCLL